MQTKRVRAAVLAGLLAVLFDVHFAASPGGTLVDAIRRDDAAAVKGLVRTGAGVNDADSGGATPLMHAALLAGPQVVRQLLDGGAAVNTANRFGATALMWAVSRPENVQLLLQRGANVNARASNGWSALVAATRHGQLASMRMLLAAGADIASPEARRHVLTASFQARSPEVRRLLREAGLVVGSRADVAGPVLMQAWNDMPSFRHLLDVGVDPKESLQTFTLSLPIFFLAARNGQLEAMGALAEKGMDPLFVGDRGITALTLTAGADRPSHEVIRFLVDQGVDVNATDTDGRTALDWALTRGETATSAFLRGLGGRANAVPAAAPAAITTPLAPREAIGRALARLQPAGRAFTDKTKCTSCHNEYIPGIAVALARRRGIAVDEPLVAHSMSATETNFQRRRELALLGETLGLTGVPPGLAYGLLERSAAGLGPSPLTDAMVIALASRQNDDGSWDAGDQIRPPLNGNVFAGTALAVRALSEFGPPGHRVALQRRVARARSFLRSTVPQDTQDQTFKLLGLIWAHAPRHEVARQRQELIKLQRPDGGWAQMPTLLPDAYATGQALYALQVAGVGADDPVYRRGVDFLLRTQLEDGTWFVRTRAFGVQPYFETGFPHGPSQFISATATAWAAIALTHAAQ
jgi:ankyrin repeat protein